MVYPLLTKQAAIYWPLFTGQYLPATELNVFLTLFYPLAINGLSPMCYQEHRRKSLLAL
jgi:hypothetical protein